MKVFIHYGLTWANDGEEADLDWFFTQAFHMKGLYVKTQEEKDMLEGYWLVIGGLCPEIIVTDGNDEPEFINRITVTA